MKEGGKLTEYAGIENTKIFGKLKEQSNGDLAWRYGYDYEGDLSSIGFKVDITTTQKPYIAGCAPFTDGDDIQDIAYDITNCDNFMRLEPVEIPIEMELKDGIYEVTKFQYDVDLDYKQTLAKFEIRIQHKQQTGSTVNATWRYPFGYAPPYFWLIPKKDNILVSKASFDATKAENNYTNKEYYNTDDRLDLVPLRILEYDDRGYDLALLTTGFFKYDLYVHPISATELGDGIQIALGYNILTPTDGNYEYEENEMRIYPTSTSNFSYTDLIVHENLIIDNVKFPEGIEEGHKYYIDITIDNYFKLNNVVVTTEWEDETETPFVGEL